MSHELEPSIYDDDPIVGKKFKSRRWPDQHGGLANASATPDNRLDMQGVEEPKSEVVLEKVAQQKYDYLHGKHGPSPVLPVLVNLLNNQIEQLKVLKDLRELAEYRIPIGQQKSFTMNYASGAGFTHLDFTDTGYSQTFGIPSGSGTTFMTPGRKLMKLKILNDGPATISISTNIPGSDRSAETTLFKGEFDDSLTFPFPIIWSANIAVASGNTSVRGFYVI